MQPGLKGGNGPLSPVGLGVLRDFFIDKDGYTKKKDQGSCLLNRL
jgi:hypothetical protein